MTDWDEYYDDDEQRYRLEDMTEVEVAGLGDSYDDGRIDAVIGEYLRLRHEMVRLVTTVARLESEKRRG